MKTVDRYLAREFTYSYVVCVVIMISLYIILDLFANIDEFTSAARSNREVVWEILNYYSYHSFFYFAQVAGMITLVAAAFTLTRLHRGNELVAFLAGGLSLYRVALPLVVMGLFFNGLWVVDQELIIPRIADKLVLNHQEGAGKKAFKVGLLKDQNQKCLLSANLFDPRTNTMEEVLVLERDSEGQMQAVIVADEAVWDAPHHRWALSRGYRKPYDFQTGFATSADVAGTALEYYESDWTPSDLVLRQTGGWTWLLSLHELNSLLKKPNLAPNPNELVAARHVRLTQPLVNMLLLFLGLPFFLNREPHNVLVSVGMCLLLGIMCFMLAFVSQTVASTMSSPALAAWLPIMVFGPVAAILMENIKT